MIWSSSCVFVECGRITAAGAGAHPLGGYASTAVVISLDYTRDGVAYISGLAVGAHAYQTIYLDRRQREIGTPFV